MQDDIDKVIVTGTNDFGVVKGCVNKRQAPKPKKDPILLGHSGMTHYGPGNRAVPALPLSIRYGTARGDQPHPHQGWFGPRRPDPQTGLEALCGRYLQATLGKA